MSSCIPSVSQCVMLQTLYALIVCKAVCGCPQSVMMTVMHSDIIVLCFVPSWIKSCRGHNVKIAVYNIKGIIPLYKQ